ncbi:unnamed protein product [Callosobruchus maculatus]|uniref:Uncharacterized protein n=1 Tax=Callosobruchus maculatus TaxID=64391 RepID=A0A653C6D4_CALMS|nr:unnamed protein product [Callosobruchus maculatus]
MEKFLMIKDTTKKVHRFGVQGRTLEFKIKPVPNNVDPVSWVKNAISQIVLKGAEDLRPTDQRVTVQIRYGSGQKTPANM